MTIKACIIEMLISSVISLAAWAMVLENVDPTTSGLTGFLLFYFTLFFALTSLFSLAEFLLRRKVFENKTEFKQAEIAFRHGFLLAMTFVGILILQGERQLNLYSAFLFVFFVLAIEFRFAMKKR